MNRHSFVAWMALTSTALGIGPSLQGQQTTATVTSTVQAFDVASIRENRSGSRISQIRPNQGGRFDASNTTLVELIQFGYALTMFEQVEGGPAWMREVRFDISATAPGLITTPVKAATPGTVPLMLQHLLATRFNLAVHREPRQAAGFDLLLARTDSTLGPNLKASPYNCAQMREMGQTPPTRPEGFSYCTIYGRDNRTRAGGHSMVEFARYLSNVMKMPVSDKTGLQGPFDIDITFAPATASLSALESAASIPTAPALGTALRDELGLRLARMPQTVQNIVIDRVDRPSTN